MSFNDPVLLRKEIYWRDRQEWLETRGYMLRPRYRPGWKASWIGTSNRALFSEDGPSLKINPVLDATRISDGKLVFLKKIEKSVHPFEIEIAQFFIAEPQGSDPRNHCVPIIEVLQDPENEDIALLVMPFLRPYDKPKFDTFGEVVECFRQLFEGLKFMHDHHVAHRDCNSNNIMMDASDMYPDGFHPVRQNRKPNFKGTAKHYARTRRPPKYYFIDFGISRRYDPADGPPLEGPIEGGDKTVPEFQGDRALQDCDPFPTDVYYIGNLIRRDFLVGFDGTRKPKLGFEFMWPLVMEMVQDDPSKRPTMDQVVAQFDEIVRGLTIWKLRSRVVGVRDLAIASFFRDISHWGRRLKYIAQRTPPIPARTSNPTQASVTAPNPVASLVPASAPVATPVSASAPVAAPTPIAAPAPNVLE